MKCKNIAMVGIMVMAIFATCVSAEENKKKTVSVSVSSSDVLLDGMPVGFEIKQFTQKLNKILLSKLDDNGFKIESDKPEYLLNVEIESMKHKVLPFHFGVSYIIDYKYVLSNAERKELLKEKNDGRNFDQFDLIDEVTDAIVKKVRAEVSK